MTESIILRDLIRKLFYLILFLSLIVYNSYAYAMAGREHAGDMVEVLTGDRSARVPDLRAMCVDFSATIDNFKVIKGIPVGLEGHRVYGHWGFSGDIPFNKPPLSEILQRVESGVLQRGGTPAEAQSARAAVKAKIIEAWKRDVANLIRLVEAETGLTGIQAKGLAGLFYDIHLLGDWSGIKLASLQSYAAQRVF